MSVSETAPEVVFLDVGDTLIRPEPSWAAVYLAGLRAHGLEVSAEDVTAALAANGAEYEADLGPFEASEAASFARIKAIDAPIMARLGHTDVPDALYESIGKAFFQAEAWHIFPDVLPALESLRSAGLRLAVISNWLWNGPELLEKLGLASWFEAIVMSARVGYQKPHPQIFERALELMEVRPERAVHVGDSYRADVTGAHGVGIRPVLLDRGGTGSEDAANAGPVSDLAVIGDLGGLLPVLEAQLATAGP
ncbi:MAG: HAD-IA family hydrolase [Chloroflexi bacterium]|nr:HAD-IA family hydrolase [Chloroflexota bacterium]